MALDYGNGDKVQYTYGDEDWGDLLTAYDGVGITHDAIGNPLTDGTWTYTWEHGRQLKSMTSTDASWNFEYEADGLRTKRTNGTTTYEYAYAGSQLAQLKVGNDELRFYYDANGNPAAVEYNGASYTYSLNQQGDVIAILRSMYEPVVEYTYNAWGELLSCTGSEASTLGVLNPFRYRGYVYDHETGLYYLQSRYYNPTVGRFINGDGLVATGQGILGNNMFAYCGNSPVQYTDESGMRYERYAGVLGIGSSDGSEDGITDTRPSKQAVLRTDLPTKLKQLGTALWNNLEFSAGVGMGYYGEATAYDYIGLSAGMYGNLAAIRLQDGQFSFGQEYNAGIAISFFGHNFGYVETAYNKDFIPAEVEPNGGFYNDESITIIGAGAYFIGGGSFRVGFDIINFLPEVDRIFRS